MDKNFDVLRAFLTDKGFSEQKRIEKMAGSSTCSVYRVENLIYRVGRSRDVFNDISCYMAFKDRMTNYLTVFPAFEIVSNNSNFTICQMEYIGRKNLEDYLFEINSSAVKYERTALINSKVLSLIRIIFDSTKLVIGLPDTINANRTFINELLLALRTNIAMVGLTERIDCLKIPDITSKDFQPSLIHRDLSVGNIILADESLRPRLIDPRKAIPHLKNGCLYGNVAFDLAGYYISLCRKEAEIKFGNNCFGLSEIIRSVEVEINSYIDSGVFNLVFFKLCLMVWYSIYSACRCEYCLAEKRRWLYEDMVKKMTNLYSEILRRVI